MRVRFDFDHKSFTPANELDANPGIWIVASGIALRYHFARLFSFLLSGG
jgi:hypothetical protein